MLWKLGFMWGSGGDSKQPTNIRTALRGAAHNQCSEAEFDHGGHTAFAGAMKHLIVGMSDSSWVIQIWYLPSGENGKARSHATKNGS